MSFIVCLLSNVMQIHPLLKTVTLTSITGKIRRPLLLLEFFTPLHSNTLLQVHNLFVALVICMLVSGSKLVIMPTAHLLNRCNHRLRNAEVCILSVQLGMGSRKLTGCQERRESLALDWTWKESESSVVQNHFNLCAMYSRWGSKT